MIAIVFGTVLVRPHRRPPRIEASQTAFLQSQKIQKIQQVSGRTLRKSARSWQIIADILWDAAQAPTTLVSGPFLFHVIEGVARIAGLGERARQYACDHCG